MSDYYLILRCKETGRPTNLDMQYTGLPPTPLACIRHGWLQRPRRRCSVIWHASYASVISYGIAFYRICALMPPSSQSKRGLVTGKGVRRLIRLALCYCYPLFMNKALLQPYCKGILRVREPSMVRRWRACTLIRISYQILAAPWDWHADRLASPDSLFSLGVNGAVAYTVQYIAPPALPPHARQQPTDRE